MATNLHHKISGGVDDDDDDELRFVLIFLWQVCERLYKRVR